MSCFGCFKSKDIDKEERANGNGGNAGFRPAPNNVSQTAPVAKVPSSVEKPSAQKQPTEKHPEKQPKMEGTKSDGFPLVDRWQQAFENLPEDKQKTLTEMGFDKPRSASVASNITELIDAVNAKQEECEKKFWKITVGGKEIVFRDYTTSIVGWLEKAGDIAIQFAPPQASLPWDLIKSLMQIPVNESEQMCALLATTERIVRITSRGQVYEQVYLPTEPGVELQPIQKQLAGALLKIYTTSLELLADSAKLLDASTARRTIEAIVNPGQFEGQLSGLKEDEDELLRDLQACEVQRSSDADNTMIDMLKTFNDPILRLDEGVAQLLAHMDECDRIEMLEWISPVPFGKHHDAVSEDRTLGTGDWLLQHEDFRAWDNTSSSLLFWLQGSPGTGKTYLTSAVIDRIRSKIATENQGFAFFYCRKGEEARSQPQSILQSFVRQLSTNANNPESVRIRLRDAVQSARDKGTNFRLQRCKEQILASLNIYTKSTLVIDALDECDPDTRDELVEALNSFIQDAEKPVKIFISSRPDPGIAIELQRSPNIGIQAGDNQDDIRKYLDVELDKLAKKVAVLKRMKEEIISKLLERAQGMFQWAVLQVHQLAKCQSAPSVRDRLNKLPASLKDSYDEVWAQINSLEDQDRTLAVRALHWVAVAFKSLTTPELLSAIRMDPNGTIMPVDEMLDQNGLLSLCNGFLSVDSQLQEWRFPHLSVQEYLESERHVSVRQGHLEAAMVSLSYFVHKYRDLHLENEPEPQEPHDGDVEEEGPSENDDGFAKMHPFHIYMRHCWVLHVQNADATEMSELSTLLKGFLGSPDDSSVQYRRWYSQAAKDLDYILTNPYIGDGFEYCWDRHYGRDNLYDLLPELDPAETAVFAMCRFSFDRILSDWWAEAKIDISALNKNRHHLLAIAAKSGSLHICKSLLERRFEINARCGGRHYGTGLVAAAAQGHSELVRYLVESGADVHMLLPGGEQGLSNALEAAVESGSLETARYLIQDAGADVCTRLPHSQYRFVLARAATIPGIEMMKLIIDAGADVNKTAYTDLGPTALSLKVGYEELESVKYLVQIAKADVNVGDALQSAVLRKDINITKLLVEAGADVHLPATFGMYASPLAAASSHSSHLEVLQFLLASGADPNLPLESGIFGTPLAVACAEGGPEIVQCLLSAGADPNAAFTRGRCGSVLAWAAFESIDVDIIKALVHAGANINMPVEHGEFGSALAAAGAGRDYGDAGVFSYLLEAGAQINMPLKHGYFGSAFAATAWRGQFDKIQLLVDRGADVNMRLEGSDFPNALAMVAAFTWGDGTVEFIHRLGVDINPKYPGKRYGSPLIAAAAFGQRDCVEYLLDNGAEVNGNYERSHYATALQAAKVGFEPEDKEWMLRYFGGDIDDIEEIVEEWAQQKPGVVELLLERGGDCLNICTAIIDMDDLKNTSTEIY
ncbi:ankyrin repeat-containing domain protein [Aspergillus pseudoustus]|uniref:Ankyrin repeat-containing domain protein n=1 Tax=Aspergillus pseudoustus TaxID=1810923 RepID=A0ABR4K7Z0_9EURO